MCSHRLQVGISKAAHEYCKRIHIYSKGIKNFQGDYHGILKKMSPFEFFVKGRDNFEAAQPYLIISLHLEYDDKEI